MELSNINPTDCLPDCLELIFFPVFSNQRVVKEYRRMRMEGYKREIFIFRLTGVVFPHTSKIPSKSAKVCE